MARLTEGSTYKGPMAIFDGDEVDFVKAFYALTSDGKDLLLQGGKPVRLVQIDLAPDNADDGKQRFIVAGKKHPPQIDAGRLVDLEAHAKAGAKAGAGS